MTPAQLKILKGLTRDELLVAIAAYPVQDRDVVDGAIDAIRARIERLKPLQEAAWAASTAADRAWYQRCGSTRLHQAALEARRASERVEAAIQRAYDEHGRICKLLDPLPALVAAP